MSKSTAELLFDRLEQWGVDTVFGLPGDGINGFMEALRTHRERIRFIQVRHEEGAAFMACGYAKFTGRLGFVLPRQRPVQSICSMGSTTQKWMCAPCSANHRTNLSRHDGDEISARGRISLAI